MSIDLYCKLWALAQAGSKMEMQVSFITINIGIQLSISTPVLASILPSASY